MSGREVVIEWLHPNGDVVSEKMENVTRSEVADGVAMMANAEAVVTIPLRLVLRMTMIYPEIPEGIQPVPDPDEPLPSDPLENSDESA